MKTQIEHKEGGRGKGWREKGLRDRKRGRVIGEKKGKGNEEGVTILASNIRQSIEKLCGLEPQHTTCEGYYFKWKQHTEDESKRSQIF